MRKFVCFLIVAPIWFVLMAAGAYAQSSGDDTVQEIVVEGAQRIEPGTVRSYLLVQVGDSFDPDRIDRSLKSLFSTGLFADVNLRRQGDDLIVTVVENPLVNRIAFEGNRKIEDEELDVEVTLRPRSIYTRTKARKDVKRILTLYRRNGRFAATVEPKVIQLPQNRIDLVFEINEGAPSKIRSIRFLGNREYSDSHLGGVIRTKESLWYRFLTIDDTYDPDRVTLDRELLRRFYLSEGFVDFRVISAVAELTPDRKDFFITFTLEEGPRYALGKVDAVVSAKGLEKEVLLDKIEIETGDWYDFDAVEKAADTLTNYAASKGLNFIGVRPRITRDRKEKTIDLIFEVAEGSRVFVERIDITGNLRTTDAVIRREFRLAEGDAFNVAKLLRSRQRLWNLGFFSKVDVEQLPGSAPDKVVITVNVQEESTGTLSVGAGWSSKDGPMGDVSVRERNLLGKGYDLNLGLLIAQKASQINLSLTDPYFLDREVAAGFDLFHTTTDYQDSSSYNLKATGLGLRAGYPITEHLRQSWRYVLKRSIIGDIKKSASIYIKEQAGESILSQVSHVLSYDRRDSRINPTDGYNVRMINDLAGLGGRKFMRNKIEGGKYFPLTDNLTFSLSASVGHIIGIGEDVRLADRFFVGGDNLRGFATSGIGPRDTKTDDALGGEWMYSGSAQLKFPLGLLGELGVSGRTFVDVGSLGGIGSAGDDLKDTGSLRASVGVGVTWVSPIGPIGIDFAIPFIKEDFDVEESFRFNFGTRF